MNKLLLISLCFTSVIFTHPALSLDISKATNITNTNLQTYQDMELSNSQPIEVLKALITTKITDANTPLRIKANFDSISGKNGSAIYHSGYLDLLSGSSFTNNTASSDGGAVYITDITGRVNLYNTAFIGNKSERSGGAIYAKKTPLNIFGGSSFINNSAAEEGGALYLHNTTANFNTNDGNILFSGNTANGKPNDIYMFGNSSLNISGSNALILDGGINNLGNKADWKNTSINNSGILDINDAKVYAGNVNFGSGSSLYVKIKDTNNYGQIFADNINIAPDGKIKITVSFAASNKDNSFVANILNADSSLNGQFGEITSETAPNISDNTLYDIIYLEDGRYQITKKPGTNNGGNNSQTGNGSLKPGDAWLNNGNFQPGSSAANTADYLYELKQTNPKAYEDALKALAPNSGTVVQNTISQINKQILSAVSSQLSGGTSGLSAGKSAGDGLFRRMRSWVKILANHAKRSGESGFSSDSNGVSMGVDKLVDDNLRIGVGYAFNDGKIDSFNRNTELTGHTAIFYGEYKPSDWFVNSIVTYNRSNYKENKNLSGLLVKSDYNADSIGLQVISGYETGIFTPQAGFRYAYFYRHKYQDSADQMIHSDNSQNLTAVIGSKISKEFVISSDLTFRPEAKLAITYDLLNDKNNTLVTLPNGAAYETGTSNFDRLGFEVGSSLHFNLIETTELSLGYEGRFRKDYQDHSGILDIKYNF